MKEIVFCVLRDDNGGNGGPSGVVGLLKDFVKIGSNSYSFRFWFNPIKRNFRYKHSLNCIIFFFKMLFKPRAFFIAHDIESAYILSLLKRNYSLVYHNQGPIIQEQINFGNHLSQKNLKYWKKIERAAFTKAKTLHFPSMGALNLYFENSYATCKKNECRLGSILYNTIRNHPFYFSSQFKTDSNTITFFSCGALTKAKGQDRVIDFLEVLAKSTQKNICYILVGKGPLRDMILSKLTRLSNVYKNFNFIYHAELDHKEIMATHQFADIYIMFHRISIFDFSTLEAMQSKTALFLSPIGGNIEFNKESNVVFIDSDYEKAAENFHMLNISLLKQQNYQVFNKYFSIQEFVKNYIFMIELNLKGLPHEHT